MKRISMNRVKPVYVMNEEGLSSLEKGAVLDGVGELLQIAGVDHLIGIKDFGVWREPGYRNPDGSLRDYQSVDWHIQWGKETSIKAPQLNANAILDSVINEPWRKAQDHYDVIVLHSDLYSGNTNFVIGLAERGIGTVISTNRFNTLGDRARHECIKTETMHELGHTFGLLPYERTENLDTRLGRHCANTCIMRQGIAVPRDWINMTEDRLRYGALCPTCETDLRNYFRD